MRTFGFITLGVPPAVQEKLIERYMSAHKGRAVSPYRLANARLLPYSRLGGVTSRCVKVAASYVWRCDVLVYVSLFDRRHELEDAVAVARRVGRPFEVYLYRNTKYRLTELVQATKKEN